MTFETELNQVFNKYGFTLSSKQTEQFKNYFKLLVLWNQRFNLTTITAQTEVITKHFLDSVLGIKLIKQNARVIDIGTGAGFPGIPIKIMREDVELHLVDSLQKRTVFLNEVVKTLELENVFVVHERAETMANNPVLRETYDYCVSRAVAKLKTILEYCSPFVKIGGSVIAYKAQQLPQEITEAKEAITKLNLKQTNLVNFNISETESERNIVEFIKLKHTPSQYPRLQNKPKTNPL